MIYALTIALIGTSAITILVAIIATVALRRNSRLERERGAAWQDSEAAQRDLEAALAGKEALKAENGRLHRENAEFLDSLKELRLLYNKVFQEREELAARSTALSEALEAKPTLPARRGRKPQTTE